MINVYPFAADVEDLACCSRIPAVEVVRPCKCPYPDCGNPAHPASGKLGIVGHGTYTRQVRGLCPGGWILIHIRRYLCLGCRRTISVLPDSLVPGYWYSAAAILCTLVATLFQSKAVADLRESVGPGGRAPHWTSPARWARNLGCRLWPWHAAEVGDSGDLPPSEFLRRLLALAGCHARSPDSELEIAVKKLAPQGR